MRYQRFSYLPAELARQTYGSLPTHYGSAHRPTYGARARTAAASPPATAAGPLRAPPVTFAVSPTLAAFA